MFNVLPLKPDEDDQGVDKTVIDDDDDYKDDEDNEGEQDEAWTIHKQGGRRYNQSILQSSHWGGLPERLTILISNNN
jgi:hypothetical protein